jgi:aryl-alcohol dehydrogenase-like predicted oxidoreductase
MQKRQFGRTGLEVSVLGFGSTVIGINKPSQSIVDRLLNTALDCGSNVIDTAECYGSEDMIGQAISHRRAECLLFTKCGHSHDSGFDLESWTPHLLEMTIDQSLRRLRTDYLDLLQLHTCTEDILRQGEVISVLQKARDAGKTRLIGYSGDSAAALYAVQCGAFDALQISVSIADQEAINLILPLAEQQGMGVIAKRPVANTVWRRSERPGYAEGVYWDRIKKLNYSFLQSGDEADRMATALRFTLNVPGVHTAIVGTQKLEHWKANLEATEESNLSDSDYQAIRNRWEECAAPDWIGQG